MQLISNNSCKLDGATGWWSNKIELLLVDTGLRGIESSLCIEIDFDHLLLPFDSDDLNDDVVLCMYYE